MLLHNLPVGTRCRSIIGLAVVTLLTARPIVSASSPLPPAPGREATRLAAIQPPALQPPWTEPPATQPEAVLPATASESPPPERFSLTSPRYFTPEVLRNDLIADSSFEESATAENWTFDSWAGTSAGLIDETRSHKGHRSARLDARGADDCRWIQLVQVKPHSTYLLGGWVKTEGVEVVQAGGHTGASIGVWWPGPCSVSLTGSNDWTYLSVIVDSGDSKVLKVCLRLGHHSSTAVGTAWFDDIHLVELK